MPYKTSRLIFLLVCSLLGLLFLASASGRRATAAPIPAAAPTTAAVTTLQTSAEGIRFVFRTPPLATPLSEIVSVPGLTATLSQPGAPALPYFSTLIALPPGAEVEAQVIASPAESYAAPRLQPAPVVADRQGLVEAIAARAVSQVEDFGLAYTPDPAIYDQDALYPAAWYTLSAPMMLRDLRVVRLALYPLRYNPVAAQVQLAAELSVSLRFVGGDLTGVRSAAPVFSAETYSRLLLNPEQAQAWHFRPNPMEQNAATVTLPVGVDAYKIAVDQDGVYQISYEDLRTAGMNVAAVNPQTFQMMTNGQAVSYSLVDDGDTLFEPGEKVLFYGWKYTGPRLDRQYIQHNIFWLWANGSPQRVSTINNPTGFPAKTTFRSSLTAEQDLLFTSTYTALWDTFPNDPDAFYWARIDKYGVPLVSVTLPVELPHPAAGAPDANFTVEVLTRGWYSHSAVATMNNDPNAATWSGYGYLNANLVGAVPQSAVLPGTNQFQISLNSLGDGTLYVNRITVDYWRELTADANELSFSVDAAGTDEFQIGGFAVGNPSDFLALNITQPTNPARIAINSADITGAGPYSLRLGSNHPADARYFVTSWANLRTPTAINRYLVANLEPPTRAVDWLAIAYPDFLGETRRLADHRTTQDGLRTWVVDVNDVINQFGYGLPIPQALQSYIRHAVLDWAAGPEYVLLVGDSTNDPRGLTCATCPIEQFVPTELAFIDRWQGLIPIDHSYSLVVGADDLPDVAVGRLPAQTVAQVAGMVDKIITFESNLDNQAPWMTNVILLADNAEPGDDFCAQSHETMVNLPPNYHIEEMCLVAPSGRTALRNRLLAYLAQPGSAFLSYRGHGSISYWAHNLMTAADDAVWQNAGKPTAILSADCLDGYFAWPGTAYLGLGEQFMKVNGGRGAVAHWSSTGLGYSFEHNVLHTAFYDSLFVMGETTLGMANVVAKWVYLTGGNYPSEGYAFVVLGDPALHLVQAPTSCSAPATPTLSVTRSGRDLQLNWTGDATALSYELWRGDNPYFPAGDADTSVVRFPASATSFTASAALGDVNMHHFYAVRGVNACGEVSPFSQRIGEVEFALQPTRWHFVSMPLQVPGLDSADSLAAAITHISSVQQWNTTLQAWDARNIKKGTGPNFSIGLGSAVRLKPDNAPPGTFALIGAAPEAGALHFSFVNGWNSLVVPWDQTQLTTADQLGSAIPHATRVRQWNQALQKFEVRTIGVSGPNFAVAAGQPYQVFVTAPGVWP